MADEDDEEIRPVKMIASEEEPAPNEVPKGAIAQAWLEKFDEEMTWGDMVAWLSEDG